MDATLQALGGILLKAVPTLFLVLLLHFYLKSTLFGPLEKVRKARHDATAGARQAAQQALALAADRAREYEAALTAARGELYKDQEELRKKWRSDADQSVGQARERAQDAIRLSREQLQSETAAARENLRAPSEELASAIAARVLGGTVQ